MDIVNFIDTVNMYLFGICMFGLLLSWDKNIKKVVAGGFQLVAFLSIASAYVYSIIITLSTFNLVVLIISFFFFGVGPLLLGSIGLLMANAPVAIGVILWYGVKFVVPVLLSAWLSSKED